MSTTACWATNEDFDCAKVYFGYGSRFDMMNSPGYWLSLRGLCAIAEYDYPYDMYCLNYLDSREPKHRIVAEQLGLEFDDSWKVDVPDDLVHKLPPEILMDRSAILIVHPNGIEESCKWFLEVLKHSGKIYKTGFNEVTHYFDWRGACSLLEIQIPSYETIEKINPLHYQWLKNIEYREEILLEEMRFKPDPYSEGRASDSDIVKMMNEWNKEENIRHEEFVKKNIWSQL
jgi:hypothetical protein